MGEENPLVGAPPLFDGLFVAFIVVFVVVVVAAIAVSIYQATRVSKSGHNPLTLQTDLAVAALDSRTLAPEKTIEQRLREVDDLRERGVISAEEHAAARAAILGG